MEMINILIVICQDIMYFSTEHFFLSLIFAIPDFSGEEKVCHIL